MPSTRARSARVAAGTVLATSLLCGCGDRAGHDDWQLPNGDLAGTRATAGSAIDAGNAHELRVRWRFAFTAKLGFSGVFASTPVADRDAVYVQDLRSNVFALERSTGVVRWARRYEAQNDGPNGLAVDGERVYGATDSDAFGLDSASGRELWRRHLTGPTEQFVDVAPVTWKGFVFLSTVGFPPGGRGAIYALDAATGRTLWEQRLPSPNFGCATVSNDVVFTSTYDGTTYAFAASDGAVLWRERLRARSNSCPAIAGDLLLVGAGVPGADGARSALELVALGVR